MVTFHNREENLSSFEIDDVEVRLGLRFPAVLRAHFLNVNGGQPDPYVFEDTELDTVVSECLPLKSSHGTGTAVDAYNHLILSKCLAPLAYFPFAVDGGGDYFFCDCSTAEGTVYFYRSDSLDDRTKLLSLGVGFKEFWACLKPE